MTPEELEALVLDAHDPAQLRTAFAPMTEKERAQLSTPAQKLFRQLYRNKADAGASDRLKAHLATRKGDMWSYWNAPENYRAALALFALGPISAVKTRDVRFGHEVFPVLDGILRDRRPEWIDDWIAHELEPETETTFQFDFPLLRGWIRDGICRKPEVDGYYRMFAAHLMRTGFFHRRETVPPITVQLLADPALLDDIEGLFRVESIAFNTNEWLTRGAGPGYETWTDALVKLSSEGHVEREHLLTLALGGLTRDLKQNQLSGFHGFYRRMAPDAAELARHQSRYVDLLCHPVGHVVKFAIDMLGEVEKNGALDADPVLREIPTVLTGQGKGNAVAALKLIKRIIARQKGKDGEVLSVVGEALRHANAEVQALALDILEAGAGRLDAAQFDKLRDAEAFVAASNRPKLAKLVGAAAASAPGSETGMAKDPPFSDYRPIADDPYASPVLSDEDAIEPIGTFDDLLDALLHAVEVVDSPDEVERIVDAISRLADERPADFDARVAPLLHRIENGRVGGASILIGPIGVGCALIDLVCTWATGRLHRTTDRYKAEDAFVPLTAHLRAIGDRVARGQGQVLLCAPTHRGGWIDPSAWVDRLRAHQHVPGLAGSMDFRLSLLRLAPDNRAAALDKTAGLAPPLGRIARFALGGEELPGRADRADHAAWIAAARCRAPRRDWSEAFASLDLDDAWPDSIRPARYLWRASYKATQYLQQSWKTPEFTVSVALDTANAPPERSGGILGRIAQAVSGRIGTDWADIPTAALAGKIDTDGYWAGELNTGWVTRWLAYVWPQNPAAAHMKGAVRLTQRLDENASNWTPGHGYFHALFQRGRPWGEAGHLLLCFGLAGKDADCRGLAVDALIEGIDARLFDPALFAATIARLCEGEWIKFNRLGDALMPVIQVSELHAAVVGETLQDWLPVLDLQQKNAFRLLEVLVEAQALTRRPLAPAARDALGRVSGSGKAAKLARQLLQG